jgi:hypothetical protein
MEYPFVANCYLIDFLVLLDPCWTVLTCCENCWFQLREQNLRIHPVFKIFKFFKKFIYNREVDWVSVFF